MNRRVVPLLLCALWLPASTVEAQQPPWETRLKDGSRLQVDPATMRPIVTTPQGTHGQLWDGVHQLQDGSTVTVRSGVIVPTREMVEHRAAPPTVTPVDQVSPCLRLMRKTCGLHDECESQQSCGHARQLLQIERDEQAEQRGSAISAPGWLETTRQCEQALTDEEFFTACKRLQRGPVATPCERLVDKVCGPTGACDAAPGCKPARQLLEDEFNERGASPYPDALTASSAQCRQALQDQEFFLPCQR